MVNLANKQAEEDGRNLEEDYLFDEQGTEIKSRIQDIMRQYAQPMAKGTGAMSSFEDAEVGFDEELEEPESVILPK